MKKIAVILVLIVGAFSLLFSCKHEIPVAPEPTPVPIDTSVCFENDILPLFQSNCAQSGCHDGFTKQNGYQLDAYTAITATGISPGDASKSRIYNVITETDPNKRMPPSYNNPLTNKQIKLIERWINEGAKNSVGCAGACDSASFKFAADVQPILQTHCIGCHGGTGGAGGYILLDTYDAVKQQVDYSLLPSITHAPGAKQMPQNGSKLNDCKITTIRKWIEAGALNN